MCPPKVSIIIPIYNVEKYIEKCIRSLFGQTLDSLEFIFINDFSPDRSIALLSEVLKEFPNRTKQVKLISHTVNKGIGISRQDGIDAATGQYIIHCDPDDWIDKNYYQTMYETAVLNSSEIVIGNYVEEAREYSNVKEPKVPHSKAVLFRDIVTHKFHTGLWNKLIVAHLAKSIKMPTGVNVWEDLSVVTPLMLKANRISNNIYNNSRYHYRIDNPSSAIHKNTYSKIYSKIKAVEHLTNIIFDDATLLNRINKRDLWLFQWHTKRGLLDVPNDDNFLLWKKTFPMSNENYRHLALPLKSKIVTWLILNNNFKIVRFIKRCFSV